MGVKLVASSGGSVELVPTNTASNFTVTVPAVTASMLTDSSGVMNIGSGQIYKDSSGNVGIGTTSPSGRVHAVSAAGTVQVRWSDATNGTANLDTASGLSRMWTNVGLAFGTGAETFTERMRIDSSGGLILAGSTAQKATGTTWSNPSDQRLKDNIRDYTKGTTELMQVRVREWEYNGKGGTTEGMKGLGVIADEVMTVLPNTVENYDSKLNADDEETTAIKKFDATEITWLLVKTVQEQQALITQLQADVAALKGTA